MPASLPTHPIDVPWTLIRSSNDVMDRTFCDGSLPPTFRSSLALYAYEPSADDLPDELACAYRVSYLKVSCSIAGFQPSVTENQQIIDLLERIDEVDPLDIEQLTREYLACYGVLLHVSVFPSDPDQTDLDQYPRIVDFEPKMREMLQAASEVGEILTTSFNKVTTTKSFASTEATENAWKVGAEVGLPKELTGGAQTGFKGETGSKRTDTDQDNWGVTSDASLDRKEKQATTSTLSQMYNLLTGYHAGSNRATFLMLPRPHVLQPTDRRSFVQGLRAIEGMQDFFLVVLRPKTESDLRVELNLQTGHFPESIGIPPPDPGEKVYETRSERVGHFTKKILAQPLASGTVGTIAEGLGAEQSRRITDVTQGPKQFSFDSSWEIDTRFGDAGHPGIEEHRFADDRVTTTARSGISFVKHVYERLGPSAILIDLVLANTNIHLVSSPPNGTSPLFNREYEVFLRREVAPPTSDGSSLVGELLITQRRLCAQIEFGGCTRPVPVAALPEEEQILEEPSLHVPDFDVIIPVGPTLPERPGDIGSQLAQRRVVLQRLHAAMVGCGSSPRRYEPGTVGYLHSRRFSRQLRRVLPPRVLLQRVRDLTGHGGADDLSLDDLLRHDARGLATALQMPLDEARQLRERTILALGESDGKGGAKAGR